MQRKEQVTLPVGARIWRTKPLHCTLTLTMPKLHRNPDVRSSMEDSAYDKSTDPRPGHPSPSAPSTQIDFFGETTPEVERAALEVWGDDKTFLRAEEAPPVKSESRELRVADLFSGCGGLSLGVREACRDLGIGFRSVLAADTMQSALRCFKENFAPVVSLSEPVEEVFENSLSAPPNETEAELSGRVGRVDILLGGPPCKGHSDLNNSTRRDDPKNALYFYMARAAKVFEPEHLLVENVVGALHDRRRVVQSTRLLLEDLGYQTSLGVVDMAQIGVPQLRKRVILLASRENRTAVEEIERRGAAPRRTVEWAMRDLIDHDGDGILDQPSNPSKRNRERMRYLLENNIYELPNKMRPPCHRDRDHSYVSVYGRLRWDRPAQTVTSGFYSTSMGRYVHPERVRTLTAHEAARLQFFPDFFDFASVVNRTALAELIGNAVPMKLSYVATHLIDRGDGD